MKKTLLIIAGSALVTGVAITAAPALSQTADSSAEVNVSVVRTADLDLSTQTGQRRLEQRLVVAANEVCGRASEVDLKGQNEVSRCREEVLSAARQKASAILAAKSGPQTITIAAHR